MGLKDVTASPGLTMFYSVPQLTARFGHRVNANTIFSSPPVEAQWSKRNSIQLHHGGSVVANSTDSNSSSLSTTAVKSLQRGHVPRGQDETGSGASAEGGGGNRLGITHDANPDSAEREHLIGPPLGAGLPTWPGRRPPSWARLDFQEEDQEEDSAPRWRSAILKPDGTVLHAEDLQVQSPPAAETSLPFSQADSSPALAVRLHSDSVVQQNFNNDQLPVPPRPQELQGGDPTSWTLSDFYDYLSPDYSTTEVLPDEDPPTTVDMADENMVPAAGSNSRSRVRDDGASGGSDSGGFPGSDGCALGYTRSNATCRSLCEVFSGYCFNGGQCYLVEGIGAFCRCNVQEYMWNKGSRCESVITDFQVMCIAVGGASVMLLLLFMVIVFFAKRLHLLKAENRRLRRRSKYRPQSEQLNDNFSLSTIAEGSQANVRTQCDSLPNLSHESTLGYYDNIACQEDCAKLEEPVKSPPSKEDESLIIQNSVTPTHENDKVGGEDNADEVISLQNNMV
ncbi:chondroitin sulfate proteoglycan 5b [Chanos chanos]|uniref:Chondroitin sulfate proteoglycan 5b n=1 Tax=Chanos chanos TaxID=29144 RepID=A0A6J2WJB0_CHACN|nr:chondroitin sulfate proteoglycan 5-like [Chanos chanos]